MPTRQRCWIVEMAFPDRTHRKRNLIVSLTPNQVRVLPCLLCAFTAIVALAKRAAIKSLWLEDWPEARSHTKLFPSTDHRPLTTDY